MTYCHVKLPVIPSLSRSLRDLCLAGPGPGGNCAAPGGNCSTTCGSFSLGDDTNLPVSRLGDSPPAGAAIAVCCYQTKSDSHSCELARPANEDTFELFLFFFCLLAAKIYLFENNHFDR